MSSGSREPVASSGLRDRRVGERRRTHVQQEAIDVIRLVRKHWLVFRNVFLAVVGLALAMVLVLPSVYSTSATVMIEPRKNNVTDQSAVLSETPTDPASIQNQIQLLTSRDLAAQVVEKLGLEDDPEFAGPSLSLNPLRWGDAPLEGPEEDDAVISAFLKHLSVSAVGLSSTITVAVTSRDPAKAAEIADTVVATYLDMQAATQLQVAQRTTDWLLGRIRQLGQQVQAAEAGIQRYKTENNLTDTTNGGSLVDQQLAAINAQLVTAREDLAAKEAENERIEALVDGGHAADVSQIVSSPLIIQLREQQTDLIRQQAQFATRYGPRHPKMIAAESQKRDLDAKIAEEVNRIVGTVKNEVAVAHAQVESLEESLQRAESEAANQNMARVKLQSLEANAASTRGIYESFVTRLRAVQGQDTFGLIDARQISHAPVPTSPSAPPRLLIALGSVPAGLMLGLLTVLLVERLGHAMKLDAPKPAEQTVDPLRGMPVLAELPAIAALHSAELVVDLPLSAPAEALRLLARRIAMQGPRVVAVTSADPREGQTSVAAGLARAASQLGLRVILLDGHLGAPVLAPRLGLAPVKAGLMPVLKGSARLNQLLQKDPRSTALLMLAGASAVSPQAIWASEPMARLMAHLKQASDIVIVDAAPIAPAGDLALAARLADALIVVAAGNGSPRLSAALDCLKSIAAVPAGLVLTG